MERLPEGDDWVYELKLDGYRAQGIRDAKGTQLLSRNGKDFSKKYPRVVRGLEGALAMDTAVDGEVVAFDDDGRPSFNALQNSGPDTLVGGSLCSIFSWTGGRTCLASAAAPGGRSASQLARSS